MNLKKFGKKYIFFSVFINLFRSADRASILQEKNKDLLKLAGCWRSEIGELDKYGTIKKLG